MLSLQVCFWVSLASCLSSLHSYWAFSFLWELFLNTESQWITKAPSSYTQSRTWLWIEGKPLLKATTFRAKINDQQQIQLLVKGEGPSLLSQAMTICGLTLLPWTQVCVCPSCSSAVSAGSLGPWSVAGSRWKSLITANPNNKGLFSSTPHSTVTQGKGCQNQIISGQTH